MTKCRADLERAVEWMQSRAPAGGGEAVAWMVKDGGWSQYFTTKERAEAYGKELMPLYAAPPPAHGPAKWTEAEAAKHPLWIACKLAANELFKTALYAGAKFKYHHEDETRGMGAAIYAHIQRAIARSA